MAESVAYTVADVDQMWTDFGPKLAKNGSDRAGSGQRVGRRWPEVGRFRPTSGANIGPSSADSGKVCPTSVDAGPNSVDFGPISAQVGRTWPEFDLTRPRPQLDSRPSRCEADGTRGCVVEKHLLRATQSRPWRGEELGEFGRIVTQTASKLDRLRSNSAKFGGDAGRCVSGGGV